MADSAAALVSPIWRWRPRFRSDMMEFRHVAAIPSAAQTYNSGMRSKAGMPWPSWSTTPLVKTENRPQSEPDISPSNSALTQPENLRAPITHRIRPGTMTAATMAAPVARRA